MILRHSKDGTTPCYWHVRKNEYTAPWAWADLKIDDSWLLRTTTGRHMLYLEGDTTNEEAGLAVGERDLDLTVDDATLAFRRIVAHAAGKSGRGTTVSG